jgi:phage RecT family recombinase
MTNETKLETIKREIFNPKTSKGFEALLPKNFDIKQFCASLWLEVQNNEKLQKCNNILDLARDCANFGLLPNTLAGQCYFIPFKDKAKLIIGYKGYITKLEEAGYTIECELVTKEEIEQERFEEIRGSEVRIIHRPLRNGIRDRANIALAYAIVRKEGLSPIITVLSKEEIEEIAKTEKWEGSSKTRQLGNVWIQNQRLTDYGQMCLKTVIRNVAKKVNLAIANEMSAYEGKRDEQIKDVTPSSNNFFQDQLEKAKQNLVNTNQPLTKEEQDIIQQEELLQAG